jgi:TonB family protein
MTRVLAFLLLAAVAGCRDEPRAASSVQRASSNAPRPDELPALVAAELPFKYPAALYARKVQGNVTLKLFIDRDGRVLPDSTRIDEPSGYPALDSAALRGASELRFVPAKLHGEPIPVSILFPVYFRHPEARPLPGDTILDLSLRVPSDGAQRRRDERSPNSG